MVKDNQTDQDCQCFQEQLCKRLLLSKIMERFPWEKITRILYARLIQKGGEKSRTKIKSFLSRKQPILKRKKRRLIYV